MARAMSLMAGSALAADTAAKVRSDLTERGFYLQVPPSVSSMMLRHYD